MSDYQIVVNPQLGFNGAGGAASATQAAAAVPVGFRAQGFDTSYGAGEFIYCQNSDVASRGQFVHIVNGSAVLLAAGNSASACQVGVVAAGWTTTGTGQYVSQPFEGNIIPESLISPVARRILDVMYSLPKNPGLQGNIVDATLPETATYDNVTFRFDQQISTANRLFVRGSWYNRDSIYNEYTGPGTGTWFQFQSYQGVIDDVDFIIGTFSKSVGTVGGFCVSNHPKFEILRLVCRPYVFTASLPPSVVATAATSIRKLMDSADKRAHLRITLPATTVRGLAGAP